MCIQLTEPALFRLRTLLRSRQLGPEAGVRLKVENGGCAGHRYDIKLVDRADADDQHQEIGGLPVFIAADSVGLLRGMEIDFIDGVMESGFRFNNPQATGSCGCGKSFSNSDSCASEGSCDGH